MKNTASFKKSIHTWLFCMSHTFNSFHMTNNFTQVQASVSCHVTARIVHILITHIVHLMIWHLHHSCWPVACFTKFCEIHLWENVVLWNKMFIMNCYVVSMTILFEWCICCGLSKHLCYLVMIRNGNFKWAATHIFRLFSFHVWNISISVLV